jgi:hypothetical protein
VGPALEQALAALINYLHQIRPAIVNPIGPGTSAPSTSAGPSTSTRNGYAPGDVTTIPPSSSAAGPSTSTPAVNTRADGEYAAVTDLATIIDTALLKAYIKTNNPDIKTLLSLPNFCHVAECEKALINFNKYQELVLLYKSKQLHSKALDLLSKYVFSKGYFDIRRSFRY